MVSDYTSIKKDLLKISLFPHFTTNDSGVAWESRGLGTGGTATVRPP